ncbi:MAG: GH32 C-terminal domain-containing protein [Bacillota bacterium]|nr:GH32 C-terminal domain-containing protein [Bacillota bacterium]
MLYSFYLTGYLAAVYDILKLHIFLNKSMIEAYINGLKGLTSRVYPVRRDALGLKVWADKNQETVKIISLKIWKLG